MNGREIQPTLLYLQHDTQNRGPMWVSSGYYGQIEIGGDSVGEEEARNS